MAGSSFACVQSAECECGLRRLVWSGVLEVLGITSSSRISAADRWTDRWRDSRATAFIKVDRSTIGGS